MTGVLEDVIYAVIIQGVAVVGVVDKVRAHPCPSRREGLGFYNAVAFRAEPEITGMVLHDVIHVADVVDGRWFHGLRLGVDAEQRAVARSNPEVPVFLLEEGAYALRVACFMRL